MAFEAEKKPKKYIIIEIPSGKMLELRTKKKNFLELLASVKDEIEKKEKKGER